MFSLIFTSVLSFSLVRRIGIPWIKETGGTSESKIYHLPPLQRAKLRERVQMKSYLPHFNFLEIISFHCMENKEKKKNECNEKDVILTLKLKFRICQHF